ncbi:MAG TPA: response regulator [Cytophagales bacterium]|nr:response regulator [Cytophagales bacterium]
MKILACDDNAFLTKIIQLKVANENLGTVDVAANGKECIRMMDKEKFDLLLLDIHMPFNSGFELLTYVRNQLKLATPIIVLSSESLSTTVRKARELGANDFMAKPFNPAELILRIKQLMKKYEYA